MIYLINPHNHFFHIHPEAWERFDSYYLQRAGCEVFDNPEALYAQVMKTWNLQRDEVEGNEIILGLTEQGEFYEFWMPEGQILVDLEEASADNYNDWLLDYRL